MLSAAACVQVNEVISGRDLECNEVPEDICVRLANHIVGVWEPANGAEFGPPVRVQVRPVGCEISPEMKLCWDVTAGSEGFYDGSGGEAIGKTYYQRWDGAVYDLEGGVVGN